MRVTAKSLLAPMFLVLLVGGLPAGAQVIYTAQGFELAGGYSTTAAVYSDPDPAGLLGQGTPYYWETTAYPPSFSGMGVAADVETSVTDGGSQAVSLTRLLSSVDTRWAPSTFLSSPYQAVSDGTPIVDIDWDMNIASGGSHTVFGIELNDNNGAGDRIAYAGVDSAGVVVDDHAGGITATLKSVSENSWHHYELQANFVTDTYSIFVDNSAVPTDTYTFENLGLTAFTNASLVSYNETGVAGATGVAYYDNYVISAVPEPSAICICVAFGGMCLPRRRRRSVLDSFHLKLGCVRVS